MKKVMFFTVLMVSAGMFVSCNAQNVTKAAQKAFAKAYPQVKNPTWEKENGNFEGNWEVNGTDHSALFTPQGKFVGSETDISVNELPKPALVYLSKNTSGNIKEASLDKDAQGTITYEADVKGTTYLFDQNGQLIKKGESEEMEKGGNSEKNEANEEGEEND